MELLSTNSQLESAVEPVEAQLEIPEAEESDRNAEVEPQIIPAIMEESLAQAEEDRPVLADLQVRQLLSPFYLLTFKTYRTTLPFPKQSTQNLSTLNLFQ